MKKAKYAFIALIVIAAVVVAVANSLNLKSKSNTTCTRHNHARPVTFKKNIARLKQKPINLTYIEDCKEPVMANLTMIGSVGRYGVDGDPGKILRVLRYKNIADAVEARYSWIPKNTILAMMAQEAGGADMLPNGNDDGGFGTIHMQGSTSSEFGLETYEDCDKLRCTKHGKELRKIIKCKHGDRKEMILYDDRFNPVLNLDAVGRMLTYHYFGPKIKGYNSRETALCRYSGSVNYRAYSRGVERYKAMLSDRSCLAKIEKEFNRLNPNFTIDGKKADFKKYIEVCREQNENYGLREYVELGKYTGKK